MQISQIKNTNSKILIQTAQKMGIKVQLIDQKKVKLKLTKNKKTRIVTKKSFGLNTPEAIAISKNKDKTHQLLMRHKIPTPSYIKVISDPGSEYSRRSGIFRLSCPLVVKPIAGEKAHNVYVGIKNKKTLQETLNKIFNKQNENYPSSSKREPRGVLIQEFIQGNDLRLFFLNGKVIGAAMRRPPQITGNGTSTIKQLINQHNRKLIEDRIKKGRRLQNRILNWDRLAWHIENQGFSLNTILPKRKTITPYPISNFQAGGTVETIPLNKIHPSILDLGKKAAQLIGLTVCGIDMIIQTESSKGSTLNAKPERRVEPSKSAYIIEVNSDPSLRLHEWPNLGKPQNITKKLLKIIFSS